MKRIGLVEDNAATRERFVSNIASMAKWELVFAAQSLAQAHAELEQLSHQPGGASSLNALLVDLGLPDGSGLELIAHVVRNYPACQVLVISVFGEDDKVFECIQAGASGYIIKGQGDDALVQHLEAMFAGGSPVSPRIARRLLQAVRVQDKSHVDIDKPKELTDKEFDILTQLALGYSYQEVAEKFKISVNTVRFHIKNIYSKLYVQTRTEAVIEAGRRGWLRQWGR